MILYTGKSNQVKNHQYTKKVAKNREWNT
jgi:hypothetical protein